MRKWFPPGRRFKMKKKKRNKLYTIPILNVRFIKCTSYFSTIIDNSKLTFKHIVLIRIRFLRMTCI